MLKRFPKVKKKYWILAIILVSVILFLIFKSSQPKVDDQSKYIVPSIRTIENKQLISGRISSSQEVNIKSELAGIIDALYVRVGDQVRKGQAIAKIRILPDPNSTQNAKRQLEISKINLERIKSNYERTKTLYGKEVIPQQEYEAAVQEYKVARAEYEAAMSTLKIVKQGFSNSSDFVSNIIYSTIDGIILDIPVKIGGAIQNRNTFSEGTTIATVADMTEFVFKGQVSEKDLRYMEHGKILTIKINALQGDNYQAIVSRISPKGTDIAGITRFDIEAKLNIKSADIYKIKSGFTATAEFIISKASQVKTLEEKYIQYNEDTAFIYVKKGEGREKRTIETGISDGQYIEIKSGIKPNDKILKDMDGKQSLTSQSEE